MRLCTRSIWVAALLVPVCVAAQEEPVEEPQLYADIYVWLEDDGAFSMDVDLYGLEGDPPPSIRDGIAAATGLDIAEIPEWGKGEDVYIISFERPDYARFENYQHHAAIDFEALRQPLREAGYDEVFISIDWHAADVNSITPEFSDFYSDDSWIQAEETFALEEALPLVTVRFGFRENEPLRRLGYLCALAVLILAGAWLIRTLGLRAPEESRTAARFSSTRRYLYLLMGMWIASVVLLNVVNPLEPLRSASEWIDEHGYRLTVSISPIFLIAVGTAAWAVLYPLYGGPIGWKRGEFVYAGFVANVFLATIMFALAQLSFAATDGNFLRVVAIGCLGLVAVIILYGALFRALGLRFQTIEAGELRNCVDRLTEKAGIAPVRNLQVVFATKWPLINAFAASDRRVMLSDILLLNFSRREIDAIVAHEVAHVASKHVMKRALVFIASIAVSILAVRYLFSRIPYDVLFGNSQVQVLLYIFFPLVAVLTYLLPYSYYSRRTEREADAKAYELTGDAEALMSGLVKLTRMNHIQLQWRPLYERVASHPSTAKRVEQLARLGAVPEERVQEIVKDAEVGEDKYALPEGSRVDRIFSTEHRNGVQLRIFGFYMVVLSVLPALAAKSQTWLQLEAPAAWAVGFAGLLVTFIAYAASENWAALTGFGRLRRSLRDDLEKNSGPVEGVFVTLAPSDKLRLYEGFSNWDVGFVSLSDGTLHYRGDGACFSLPRAAIESIDLVQFPYGFTGDLRAKIQWRESPERPVHAMMLATAEARTLRQANRETKQWLETVKAWHSGASRSGGPEALEAPPSEADAGGQLYEAFVTPRRIFSSAVLMGIGGFVIAYLLRLPVSEPFLASCAYVGGVAGLTTAALQVMSALQRKRR